jgi:hypothetical protein
MTIPTVLSTSQPEPPVSMRDALERSVVAIDDWLQTYAAEFCDPARVEEASKRIGEYGTLSYIASVQEQNRAALDASTSQPAEIATIRRYVKAARGAIESGQVVDKDVHGTLTKVIEMLDALAATPAVDDMDYVSPPGKNPRALYVSATPAVGVLSKDIAKLMDKHGFSPAARPKFWIELEQMLNCDPIQKPRETCHDCGKREPCDDDCPNCAAAPAVGGEPVAWRTKNDFGHWHVTQNCALAETWRETEKLEVQPLYAAQPASPLRGRDLDWQETFSDRGDGSRDLAGWEANSGFGPWYDISIYFGDGWRVTYDSIPIGDADSPERAKKIAQDDFANRVLYALSASAGTARHESSKP